MSRPRDAAQGRAGSRTSARTSSAARRDNYPQPCGWCGNPVLTPDGWLLHGWALCRILQDIGDPPCLVTVKEDVYEWLTT